MEKTSPLLADVRGCLMAANVAAYQWNTETDQIVWSANAEAVLGCKPEDVSTGKAFAAHLRAENLTNRYETVMNSSRIDEGHGVAFEIEYEFHASGGGTDHTLWLEDIGRWFRGDASHPMRASGLVRRINARHEREQELSFSSSCDPLTGFVNHDQMTDALGTALATARAADKSCAFVIVSLRNLGAASDACGYAIADEVILAMSRRLQKVIRAEDIIARYSKSKFAILLHDCDEADLQVATERFLNVARDQVVETTRGPVWAMLAIGGVVVPQHATEVPDIIARAGEALADALHLSADGACFYQPSSARAEERVRNARYASEIVACLSDDRFRLAWQPVMTEQSAIALQHEALLRLQDEHGEIIEAQHLIPIAEQLGLARLIDRAVLHMALSVLITHSQAHIAINFSGITINDPRWFAQLANILSDNRDVMNRLTIEIPDTVARGGGAGLTGFAEILRDLGCHLSIDQFGMGPAMFSHPRALGATSVKLDGSLCAGLAQNPDLQPYVRFLIEVAHKHGIRAIATRVETAEDAALLRKLGCDALQGRFFGDANLLVPWTEHQSEAFGFRSASVPQSGETGAMATGAPEAIVENDIPMRGSHTQESFLGFALNIPDIITPEPAVTEVAEIRAHPAIDTLLPRLPPLVAASETLLPPLPDFEPDLSALRQAIEALSASFSTPPEPKTQGRPAA